MAERELIESWTVNSNAYCDKPTMLQDSEGDVMTKKPLSSSIYDMQAFYAPYFLYSLP